MAAHVRVVQVPDADRRELQRRARDKGAPAREVERVWIVLSAAEGTPGKEIATIVGCAEGTVVTWRGRYAEHGLAGLEDLPRPGKPAQLPEALRDRVLESTPTGPPDQLEVATGKVTNPAPNGAATGSLGPSCFLPGAADNAPVADRSGDR